MGLTRTSSAAAALTVALLFAPGAFAQETKRFDVPAQDAATALRTAAIQGDFEILIPPAIVSGKKTRELRGEFSNPAALGKLLEGTGLTYKPVGGRTYVVEERANPGGPGENPTLLAQAPNQGVGASDSEAKVTRAQESVVVTGSRLFEANQSLPIRTYTAERIEQSGKTTIAEFLNTLPTASVQSTPDRASVNGGQTTVRLRGFPTGTTGLLLNGRRLPSVLDSSFSFNLTDLPLAFIDRIDVLPSGSSAIYGSDAIAGVVNFITKRDVSGLHLTAAVGSAADYTSQSYSGTWGAGWAKGGLSLMASYEKSDRLFGQDRDIVNNADYRRFSDQGGVDRRVLTCSPGNVVSVSATNLPGLTSTTAVIPNGITGRPQVGDFSATQGTQSLCASNQFLNILPATERVGAFGTGYYQLTTGVELFAEILLSRTESSNLIPVAIFSRTVPASNAFNPFGVNVNVRTQLAIESGILAIKNYFRPLLGLRGTLFSRWDWEVAAWRSQERGNTESHGAQITAAVNAALASSDPASAINPFSRDNAVPASVLPNAFALQPQPSRSDLNAVDARVRGPLFDLPAGPVTAVVGAECGIVNDFSRRFNAVYSEARLPILGGRPYGGDLLDITAAGRYDRYSDFGGKATPQVGVELRPVEGLLLRGSYAQSFRAPQLSQLYQGRTVSNLNGVVDTARPGNPITNNVQGITVGNLDLKAEVGRANSFGVALTGKRFQGLRASVDYWRLVEDERIANPSVATEIAFPDIFPGRVSRDANGVITSVISGPANFGRLEAEGIDLDVAYAFDTDVGRFTASVDWVTTTKFRAAITPGASPVNRLGQATSSDAWAVRSKGTLGLDWARGRYSANLAARYLGSYLDYVSIPPNTNRLGNYYLFDAGIRVDLGDLGGAKRFRHATLNASIVNVANKSPQYSNFIAGTLGYDPAQADILGRFVRVGLAVDW